MMRFEVESQLVML